MGVVLPQREPDQDMVAAIFAKEPGAWSVAEYELAQCLAVSGPVNIVWDVDVRDRRRMIMELIPVPQPDRRDLWPIVVSAAAINFAYSPQDQELYLEGSVAPFTVKQERVLQRMCTMWHHAFTIFQEHQVQVPVLSAPGCGAFRGTGRVTGNVVPRLWATHGKRARIAAFWHRPWHGCWRKTVGAFPRSLFLSPHPERRTILHPSMTFCA